MPQSDTRQLHMAETSLLLRRYQVALLRARLRGVDGLRLGSKSADVTATYAVISVKKLLKDTLSESPDGAEFVVPDTRQRINLNSGTDQAITFGMLEGKVLMGTHSDLPPEWAQYCPFNKGVMTHAKLATMRLHPEEASSYMRQLVHRPDTKKAVLKEFARLLDGDRRMLYHDGRAWFWPEGGILFVSFWDVIPESADLQAILRGLQNETGGAERIMLQSGDMNDHEWTEEQTATKSNVHGDAANEIKRLSALLHTATPDQKVAIKQQIAKLRQSAGLEQDGRDEKAGWGAARAGQVAAKEGYRSPVERNAALRQESRYATPRFRRV